MTAIKQLAPSSINNLLDEEALIKEARQRQQQRHRLIAAAVAVFLLLTIGLAFFLLPSRNASPPTKTNTAPVATLAGSCTSRHLTVSPGANFGIGAGGTDGYPLVFTNTGTTSCSLRGFPRVSFLDSHGNQIAGAAIPTLKSDMITTVPRDTSPPVNTLAPGHSVTAIVVYYAGEGSSCKDALTVHAFRIYPPGQSSPFVVLAHTFMCSHTPPGSVAVYPFGVGHFF